MPLKCCLFHVANIEEFLEPKNSMDLIFIIVDENYNLNGRCEFENYKILKINIHAGLLCLAKKQDETKDPDDYIFEFNRYFLTVSFKDETGNSCDFLLISRPKNLDLVETKILIEEIRKFPGQVLGILNFTSKKSWDLKILEADQNAPQLFEITEFQKKKLGKSEKMRTNPDNFLAIKDRTILEHDTYDLTADLIYKQDLDFMKTICRVLKFENAKFHMQNADCKAGDIYIEFENREKREEFLRVYGNLKKNDRIFEPYEFKKPTIEAYKLKKLS